MNFMFYTDALNNTVKCVIMRKLPDRLFMTLARHYITTVSKLKKLKQVAQRELRFNIVRSKQKSE